MFGFCLFCAHNDTIAIRCRKHGVQTHSTHACLSWSISAEFLMAIRDGIQAMEPGPPAVSFEAYDHAHGEMAKGEPRLREELLTRKPETPQPAVGQVWRRGGHVYAIMEEYSEGFGLAGFGKFNWCRWLRIESSDEFLGWVPGFGPEAGK